MEVKMVIFINGAFGVGKTTLAEKIAENQKNFMLYDPEMIGGMLRSILPKHMLKAHEKTGDFQDYDLWRILTVESFKHLKNQYNCDFVIPMTLCNKTYCDAIVKGIMALDSDCHHFVLEASKETIHSRLIKRGEEPNAWAFKQTDRCLEGFEHIENAVRIYTEDQNAEKVYQAVITHLNLREEVLEN